MFMTDILEKNLANPGIKELRCCNFGSLLRSRFWGVTQRSLQKGGALRDTPNNGCEGDYNFGYKLCSV